MVSLNADVLQQPLQIRLPLYLYVCSLTVRNWVHSLKSWLNQYDTHCPTYSVTINITPFKQACAISALLYICWICRPSQKVSFGTKHRRPFVRREESHWFISSSDCGFSLCREQWFILLLSFLSCCPQHNHSALAFSEHTSCQAHSNTFSEWWKDLRCATPSPPPYIPPPSTPFWLSVINHRSFPYLCPLTF